MRSITTSESQFTAGGDALGAFLFLSALSSVFDDNNLYASPYYVSYNTPSCGWQPYLREQRTPLYNAYGMPTGLDDVVTIEDYRWVCV